jgi:hypothetical protein
MLARDEFMHYRNQDNFEGLLELGHELRKVPELTDLAEYCTLREKGLRKQALRYLDGFLKAAASWDTESARSLVLTILFADARTPKAHQFMTHPLLTRLIYPTLEQWKADNPSAIEPLRWLGLLHSDINDLKRALALDPADVPVRRRLINLALDDADYATHHLSESVLLLTIEETRKSITAAREQIASAPDLGSFADLSAKVDVYEQMVNDWVAYKLAPMGTFPEWCERQGRMYSWPTIVYYDDGSGLPTGAQDGQSAGAPSPPVT